ISCATSRRSQASSASPTSCRSMHHFRPRRFRNSSPMPRPIGTIKMASPGTATAPHVVGELFKIMAGVDLVHVPYPGTTSALNALVDGQVQVYCGTGSASIEDIRAGRLLAMAVTTTTRSEALPNTPTIGESVPGLEAGSVFGIGAPKNTPIEIVDALNKKIN